ncbi:MAG: pilus assembly protein, partial [Erysipelotrichaceae bacterium]|nr:pilus assembly protein [Erysipelotrichaceae bacterium]
MGSISMSVPCYADNRLTADLTLTYSESSHDIATNSSLISWHVTGSQQGPTFVGTNRSNAGRVRIWVDSHLTHEEPIGILNDGASINRSGVYRVYHNQDGNKTIPMDLEVQPGTGNYDGDPWIYTSKVVEGTIKLTHLPRLSNMSVKPSEFVIGTPETITVTKQISTNTHTIRYQIGKTSGTIVSKSGDTSISWTPPASLASEIPTTTSIHGTLYCDTYYGNTMIGTTSLNFVLKIGDTVKPKITGFTVSAIDNKVPKDWGIYVQAQSKLQLNITAEGIYGSKITDYSISGGGFSAKDSKLETGLINKSGDITFTAEVKDSRGKKSDPKKIVIHVEPY